MCVVDVGLSVLASVGAVYDGPWPHSLQGGGGYVEGMLACGFERHNTSKTIMNSPWLWRANVS